jgi:hypothetical protein
MEMKIMKWFMQDVFEKAGGWRLPGSVRPE